MSASAPLGRPSRNTGRVEADCTSATITGEVVSEVIIHAAATSFIHMQVLAATQVIHSRRKVGAVSGSSAAHERGGAERAVSGLAGSSVRRLLWGGEGGGSADIGGQFCALRGVGW